MNRPDHKSRAGYCLNLDAIESTLRRVQRDFPRINKNLCAQRDLMDDEMIANMMSAYSFIDTHIGDANNLFALGNLKHLIELNRLILCGTDSDKRKQFSKHLLATETQFYDQSPGGIRDIVEWYEMHRRESVWRRASGVYIRMLSYPQLFIEGNHRTGALIMGYLLAREGKPPFVLTVDNAQAFFDLTSLIKNTERHSIIMWLRMPGVKRQFAKFLQENTNTIHMSYGNSYKEFN